jgi:ribosomal protein L37AE/L43A
MVSTKQNYMTEIKNDNRPEPEVIRVVVKKWEPGISYPCPKCEQPTKPNSEGRWICESCNVRIKAVMNF